MRSRLKDYRRLERFDADMLGKPAKGIRFSYSATDKDVKQYGEMRVVKIKRRFYVTYCLCRLEGQEENGPAFQRFQESLSFG